jgi:hypothetical protein
VFYVEMMFGKFYVGQLFNFDLGEDEFCPINVSGNLRASLETTTGYILSKCDTEGSK